MASPAHCFYCFEVLAASYQSQSHPDLQSVVQLYDKQQKEQDDQVETNASKAAESMGTSHTPDLVEEQYHTATGELQLPSISRLRNLTPSSGNSAMSTPSSASVNSSNSQLTSANAVNDTPAAPTSLSVTDSFPLFVTWNTLSRSGRKSLRGCIGTFEALPLEQGLESYALTSAFEDTRFSPISANSVQTLSCSLTLLADFEDCDGPMDWELGEHGIRISFTHKNRRHGATYLPDVAVEQGWTQEETLESLMRKGGWEPASRRSSKGSGQPWDEVRDFRVVRYTGLKASASFTEWQAWQQWAKKRQPESWS